MPIRNPFARRSDIQIQTDENTPPQSQTQRSIPAFERVDTVGSRTSAISVKSGHSEPAEYKLSGEHNPAQWHNFAFTPI